jgi:hypothetical protein
MNSVMALALSRPCPHCGQRLRVLFKRDMYRPDAPLLAAVVHGEFEQVMGDLDWHPVTGFEDMARLSSETESQ